MQTDNQEVRLKRRAFLKGLGAFFVAPMAVLKGVPQKSVKMETGFGLAPIKAEGQTANFFQSLWPAHKAWWDKHYEDRPAIYKELFLFY